MPGTKGYSGGKRLGAGRKRTKTTITIDLTEQTTRELLYFIEDLNLDRSQAQTIVSAMVTAALRDDLDRWRDRFGNGIGNPGHDP